MNQLQIWILVLIGLGLFVYFVPYKDIKIVHKKLNTIIELLNKKTIYLNYEKEWKSIIDNS